MSQFDYDLFVIGAGSGGVRAARVASGYGARVAIAEEYRVGGTCVIRGCVPKKILVLASRCADDIEDARGFGWTLDAPKFDWAALIAAKDREIARLEAIYKTGLAAAKVETIDERATVTGAERRDALQVRAQTSPPARSSSPPAARRRSANPFPASSTSSPRTKRST